MPNITVPGLSDSAKVPKWYGAVQFGQSQIRFGSLPVKCLCIGLAGAATGSLAYDSEIRRILSKEDADTAAVAGNELAHMLYDALDETAGMSGFELYGASPSPAGGATASALTITVTGTASANGTIYVWVHGIRVEVNFANLTAQNAIASAIAAAVNLVSRFPALATPSTNTVALAIKSAGIRGNQHICYVDFSAAPGVTVALSGTGGAAVTSSSTLVGRTFGNGTGTETLTNLQTALFPTFHKFVAPAQNDATSLASWETYGDSKASAIEGRKEHFVVGNNGNFAAATSIAQTTLNNARFSLKWLEIGEQHPSAMAAAVACLRAANEQGSTVNKGWDGYAYRTLKPQRFAADWVTSYAEKQAALDVGVSPMESKQDGKVYEVRSITTRCRDGNVADYRTIDTSQAYVTDYANERLELVWTFEFLPANPWVAPDPTDDEPDRAEGIATPLLWNKRVAFENTLMERERILTQTALTPPSSEYNYAADRIMTVHPVIPLPIQHSIGVVTKQLNTLQAA